VGKVSRILAVLTALVTVVGGVLAANGTLAAHRYEARTSEDFVYVYVLAAWAGVLLLAAIGGGMTALAVRRERRRALRRGDQA
jgi:uncharacterized membrane protein